MQVLKLTESPSAQRVVVLGAVCGLMESEDCGRMAPESATAALGTLCFASGATCGSR